MNQKEIKSECARYHLIDKKPHIHLKEEEVTECKLSASRMYKQSLDQHLILAGLKESFRNPKKTLPISMGKDRDMEKKIWRAGYILVNMLLGFFVTGLCIFAVLALSAGLS